MEVHHHPEVEKKSLKDYILEGLMIFVAVMMGFFAESLRESINDKEKERQYINSLINNLEQDEIDLNYHIGENTKKIKGLDSLLSLSFQSMTNPLNRQLLYNYSSDYVSLYSGFSSNDATMMQLKNAGGLQYIKHNHIADSIAIYDQVTRSVNASETPYAKAINDAMDAMSGLLIFKVRRDTAYLKRSFTSDNGFPLLTNDSQKIEIFFNKIALERGWTKNYIDNLQQNLPYTIRLVKLLKKEYGND